MFDRTTLWLRVWQGLRLELSVWYPPRISAKERTVLLAKHASQGVRVIRELTGATGPIVQGQYKEVICPWRDVLIEVDGPARKLSIAP